jgi:integrase
VARRRGHYEGHKYQRKDGRWEWKITLPNGVRRSFYGKTEREAREKKNQAIRDFESGLAQRNERLTVDAYLADWLEGTAKQRVRPSTFESYRSHVDVHLVPALRSIRLRDLSSVHVNRMLTALVAGGMSPTTANRVRATLRTALTSAVKDGLILRNVAALSEPRRERRERITPLTADQARLLIRATREDRIGPLIEVAILSGMRQGELLALRWQDVDLEQAIVHVRRTLTWRRNEDADGPKMIPEFSDPKTEQSRRSIRLPQAAVDALKRQQHKVVELEQEATVKNWRPIPGEDLVFPSAYGTPLNNSNVTHRLQLLLEGINARLTEDAKLPRQRFHDLRHATASLLLAGGVDLFTVKEILGHSQISLTANIYGHLTDKLADDAAARLHRALADDKSESLTTKLTTDALASDSTSQGNHDA